MPADRPTPAMTQTLDRLFSDEAVETIPTEVAAPTTAPTTIPTTAPAPATDPDDMPDDILSAVKAAKAPVPTTPPPATEDGELTPVPTEGVPPAAKPIIERYAYEAREERRRRKEMEVKMAEAAPATEDAKKMQERVQQLENELGRLDLERSPAFQDQYGRPIQLVEAKATSVLVRAGVGEDVAKKVLEQVFSKTDIRQQERVFDDLDVEVSPAIVGAVLQLAVERDEASQARAKALGDWKASRASVEERANREKQARDVKDAQGLLSTALEEVRSGGNPFFTRSDANSEWNVGVVTHFEEATLGVLQRNDPKEIATLVAHGLTFPRLLTQFAKERERRLSMERDGFQSSPAVPASGRPAPVSTRTPTQPVNTKEALDRLFPA